jgi:hypothetical protein
VLGSSDLHSRLECTVLKNNGRAFARRLLSDFFSVELLISAPPFLLFSTSFSKIYFARFKAVFQKSTANTEQSLVHPSLAR